MTLQSAHTQQKVQTIPPFTSGILQRKCACGNHTIAGGECAACKQMRLQRQVVNASGPKAAPPIVHEVLRSSGQPLDAVTRAYMEPRFGRDFSQVRVHTDAKAAESARAVNAQAYTVGQNVVFGAGKYSLATNVGRNLLAHELTHTVQQRNNHRLPKTLPLGRVDDSAEQEANRLANSLPWRSLHARYRDVSLAQDNEKIAPSIEDQLPLGVSPLQLQRVELTYDDGPDEAGYTRKILEELKQTGAKATFYVVGRRVVEGDNWRVVFDIAASGNWLGNHAFDWNIEKDNHIFLSGSSEERARKILLTEWAIRDALIRGKAEAQANKNWETIPATNRAYIEDVIAHGTGRFRTPGFRSKWWREDDRKTIGAIADVNQILAAAGLRIFEVSDEVDVDPKDWEKGKTGGQIEKNVAEELDEESDSILLHSRIAASAEATPAIIADITKKGWSFGAPARGETGKLMPMSGFAGLSTISDPPTQEQIKQAQKFLFDNPQYGPILLGHVAIGIFKMAQAVGETEVREFIKMLETTVIKTDKCEYYAATCLAENNNFALLYRFLKVWIDKTPFPRDPSKY